MKKTKHILLLFTILICKNLLASPSDSLMNVEYGKAEMADFSYKSLTMDIFFPLREEGKKYPLVLLMHGGGFLTGSKEAMKANCKFLADSGFIAVSINYRKGWRTGGSALTCDGDIEDFKLAIYRATQDARAAMRFLVDKQNDYAIDTAWLFAGGSSAGGVLALNLAYFTEDWAKKNMKDAVKELGGLDKSSNKLKNSFTIKGICNMWGGLGDSTMITPANALPTIFYHGSADPVVPYDAGRYGTLCDNYPLIFGSACLYRQTIAAGKPAVLNTSVGGTHGPKEFWYKITMSNTACFFKRVMEGTAGSNSFTNTKVGCRN